MRRNTPRPSLSNDVIGRTWPDVLIRPPRWILYSLLLLLSFGVAVLTYLWTTGSQLEYGDFRIGPPLAQAPEPGSPSDGSPVNSKFKKRSVLFITGNASANGGVDYRSYLTVRVLVDKKECSANQSYVPNNWKITHVLSTLCVFPVVPDKTYTIEVISEGEGIENKKTHMSYTALPSS